jgi:hypothetical protein
MASAWGLSWSNFWGRAWGAITGVKTADPQDISLRFSLSSPEGITGAPDDLIYPRRVGFMTTRDAVMELWDLSGHASDLYPFFRDIQDPDEINPDSEGTQYFFRLLTQGQIALANWKKLDQRFLRFRQFYKHFNIQLGVDPDEAFDITRVSATEFNIDPTQSGFNYPIDILTSALIVINDTAYKIMSIAEVSPTNWTFFIYPDLAEEETPSYPETITDVSFALNEFNITSSPSPPSVTYEITLPADTYNIFRIDDYESQTEITRARDIDELSTKGEAFATGTPSQFLFYGDKIIFDTALAEKRWYKFEIFRQPAELTSLDQSLELPPQYHQALVFWCMWKIAMRERQEINMTNYRRLLDKELMSTRDEYDELFERTQTKGFQVRRS